MLPRALKLFFVCCVFSAKAQDLCKNVACLTVDDKAGGYVITSYRIPSDGYYVFSIDGGLSPKNASTIYYYEYYLALQTRNRKYLQEFSNIGSQAQDGNVCFFNTHDKSNRIAGTFCRDELVEFRLILLKSDVNGEPHRKLRLTPNTLVRVEKNSELATQP